MCRVCCRLSGLKLEPCCWSSGGEGCERIAEAARHGEGRARRGTGWLLYSLGPNLDDDGGVSDLDERGRRREHGDVILRLPEE